MVEIARESPERPDVMALLETVSTWSADLYPAESRHGLGLDAYARPDVALFVAREGGIARGCCAYQLQGERTAELKSLFVSPGARGAGLGRALVEAIEAALADRADVLRLETGVKQEAAIRLYERTGFRRRGPFGGYRDDPLSVFMEKPLTTPP